MAEETNTQTNQLNIASKYLNKKNIKTAVIALILLVIALVAYFYRGEVVAATVNGQPVSRYAVVTALEKQGGQQVLDTLITKALIRQEARKQGVQVAEEDIEAKISEIELNLSSQGMTLEQALKEQGMTRAELNEELSIQIELEKLVSSDASVSDEEVNEYIAQNELKPADVTDVLKEQIKEQIMQQKKSAAIDDFITQIRQEAKVEYLKKY